MINPIKLEPFKLDPSIEINEGANKSQKPASFSEVLKDSMLTVNDLQHESGRMIQKLALGEVTDISEVSIAVEKGDLALRLMVQIRDKLLDMHQQLSRIQ